MDVSKSRDGWAHFRKSGMKGLTFVIAPDITSAKGI